MIAYKKRLSATHTIKHGG